MPKPKRRVTKATKVPSKRVSSADYVVKVDGKEYRPHAGEWIDFRGSTSVASTIVGLRLQSLLRVAELSVEEAAETSALYEQVTEALAGSIAAWNWTDDDGNALPSPPTPEVVRGLSLDELFWLLGARFGQRSEEASKNV